MGYRKVRLYDVDFRRAMMDAVPEIRINGKVEFKRIHKKGEKEKFLYGLVMDSLLGRSRHKNGGLYVDSFSYEKLSGALGRDYEKLMCMAG